MVRSNQRTSQWKNYWLGKKVSGQHKRRQQPNLTRPSGAARLEEIFASLNPPQGEYTAGVRRGQSRQGQVGPPSPPFARLGGMPGGLTMQVQSSIRDRRGMKIAANFSTVLRRQQ